MSTFSLGQSWVSHVTRPSADEVSFIGSDLSPMPTSEQFEGMFRKVAVSEAAREMVRRKWFQPATIGDKIIERGTALQNYLFEKNSARPAFAMFRGRRSNKRQDMFEQISTMAWITHVTDTAKAMPHGAKFSASVINQDFVHRVMKLSSLSDGPRRALGALHEIGIHVVVESSLPGMSVDGASFHIAGLGPVLALTLRHDRLDNFWFTLWHEIGHIALHLSYPSDDIYVDSEEENGSGDLEAEAEADAFAMDSLIPRDVWLRSEAHRLGDENSVIDLARKLGIHPAIVAGRIRHERREFRIFNNLVGQDEVRNYIFTD